MSTKFVKPREGMLIRDPYSKERIPPEGADVNVASPYGTLIEKHLAAGDLVEASASVPNALREVATDQRVASSVLKKGEV